jgi:hypothetical protein
MSERDHDDRPATSAGAPQSGHESRPEPEREGPDRRVPPLRDRLGAAAGARADGRRRSATGGAQTASPGGKTIDQVVAETVRTAYDVIGENILHGRHTAERLRQGSYQTGDVPEDFAAVAGRLLRLGMDLSMTWFHMMAAVMRDPRLAAAFDGADGGRPATSRASARRSPRIVYQVHCSRPHEVDLNLHALAGSAVPASADLYPGDGRSAPIRGVRFESGGEGVIRIVIRVPDDQPPATYSGAVIDRDTHEPIGTLRLKIDS